MISESTTTVEFQFDFYFDGLIEVSNDIEFL